MIAVETATSEHAQDYTSLKRGVNENHQPESVSSNTTSIRALFDLQR